MFAFYLQAGAGEGGLAGQGRISRKFLSLLRFWYFSLFLLFGHVVGISDFGGLAFCNRFFKNRLLHRLVYMRPADMILQSTEIFYFEPTSQPHAKQILRAITIRAMLLSQFSNFRCITLLMHARYSVLL